MGQLEVALSVLIALNFCGMEIHFSPPKVSVGFHWLLSRQEKVGDEWYPRTEQLKEKSLCDFPCGLLLAVQSMLLVYFFLYINVRGNVCLSLDSHTSLDLLICCASLASLLGKASIGTFF